LPYPVAVSGAREAGHGHAGARQDHPLGRGNGLANETDFLDLYRKLGLSPGCDLAEFKRAYRRHVSQLHPDREGGDAGQLQASIAQYGAAIDFHRRHGRLPGAAAQGRVAPASAPSPPRHPPSSEMADEPAPVRSRSKLLFVCIIAVLGILAWSLMPSSSPENAPAQAATDNGANPAEAASANVASLSLGMSPAEVRAIEGDPLIVHRDRWDYGPSWIQFENDQVIDWYSSPLHSLRTATSRPSEAGR
jgi:hypothetical protein